MLQPLLLVLIDSKNEAEDLLLEGLRPGSESERAVALDTFSGSYDIGAEEWK